MSRCCKNVVRTLYYYALILLLTLRFESHIVFRIVLSSWLKVLAKCVQIKWVKIELKEEKFASGFKNSAEGTKRLLGDYVAIYAVVSIRNQGAFIIYEMHFICSFSFLFFIFICSVLLLLISPPSPSRGLFLSLSISLKLEKNNKKLEKQAEAKVTDNFNWYGKKIFTYRENALTFSVIWGQ